MTKTDNLYGVGQETPPAAKKPPKAPKASKEKGKPKATSFTSRDNGLEDKAEITFKAKNKAFIEYWFKVNQGLEELGHVAAIGIPLAKMFNRGLSADEAISTIFMEL